jgi:large subunit ribosomal protein L23
MIFDFLKKKGKPALKEKKETKGEKPVDKPKEEQRVLGPKLARAPELLLSPQITEKATWLAEKNQYIFKVFPTANKTEIKKAVESLYRVKVVGVKIIKVPSKRRRLGKSQGWKKGYKKAIIRVKEGQKIEVTTA